MESNQSPTTVSATKTLYENFLEEKCETDFLIPDYFPAAEKIIHCAASPVIVTKQIVGERLILEGNCKFTVIYLGEEEGGVKSLSETVQFEESLPVKEAGEDAWVQAIVRMGTTSCRLLNPRKINCRANASVAIKVKEQRKVDIINKDDCDGMESLFDEVSVYTVVEHPGDNIKVQGEIEAHTAIQDILKIDGYVVVKDAKVLPGKAVMKGVLNLFLLFTPESDPQQIESTSTAIPFTQVLETENREEDCSVDLQSYIRNIRADVESDHDGKNRLITITANLQTEGELYRNVRQELLVDAYSNAFPVELKRGELALEELFEQCEFNEMLHHSVKIDVGTADVTQITADPMIQKISGQGTQLAIDGVLDITVFFCEGGQYFAIDKSLPFTLKKELRHLNGRMRCEIHPVVVSMNWSKNGDTVELKTELSCSMMILARNQYEVVSGIKTDEEHPYSTGDKSPLVIYFGDKGERLWDIARRYSTSVMAIKEVNGLEADCLDAKKLLLISRS